MGNTVCQTNFIVFVLLFGLHKQKSENIPTMHAVLMPFLTEFISTMLYPSWKIQQTYNMHINFHGIDAFTVKSYHEKTSQTHSHHAYQNFILFMPVGKLTNTRLHNTHQIICYTFLLISIIASTHIQLNIYLCLSFNIITTMLMPIMVKHLKHALQIP